MAALLMARCSALAQENQGTEEQRVACTPRCVAPVFLGNPNVDRIVACLRREKSQLSAGCRQVLKIEATAHARPLTTVPSRVMRRAVTWGSIARPWITKKAICTNSAPRRPG